MSTDKETLAEMLTVLLESDLALLKSGEATPADKERMRKILADHGIQAGQKNSPVFKLAQEFDLPFKNQQTA
jgi:hypothetical protein